MSTPTSQSPRERLPGNLETNRRLSMWINIDPAGHVEITPGKVEIGQGILTALTQIAADELDVEPSRIRIIPANTGFSPNEGVTSGSMSVQDSGTALRYACAEARSIYLKAAADRLGVAAATLSVDDGAILGEGNAATSYWELADPALLDRDASADVPPKAVGARRLAGRPFPRVDIADKVFGARRFIQDLSLPDLLHGRILRPPRQGAKLRSLDDGAVAAQPGVVAIARDGDFVGVVADDELAATDAVRQLSKAAVWEGGTEPPDGEAIGDWLRRQPVETSVSAEHTAEQPVVKARTVRRTYTKPYLAHASIGPSCALAQWSGDGLRVWTHSQGIFNLRSDLALVLGLPAEKILVEHVEGAGCYGHNGADDVALDAVLLARAAEGRPVRVQWTREEELAWGPLTPAMAVTIEADLDAGGEVVAWRHEIWSNGHTSRPGRADYPTLLAAPYLARPFALQPSVDPPLAGGGGADRNAIPAYDFPNWRVTKNRLLVMPVRTSAMRSLGGYANVFAIESLVDELAAEAGEDPVAWRLRHLSDPRARDCVAAAARRAGWSDWDRREGFGHGVGYARYKHRAAYCAVVAEVEVERAVRVHRLVAAVDVGEAINPDGIVNQTEGGCIQAASWTLLEAVKFEGGRIASDSWETYPILTFSQVPQVEVELVNRPEERPLGGGEHAMGPVAAAIANAVCDALGVRVRDLPITPERVIAAMELGGSA